MLHTTPAVFDSTVFPADPPMVFKRLTSDEVMRLSMSVSEFRSAGRRLIGELYVMTQQLCVMREILGDDFRSFVQQELDLGNRMVSRYMHINKVLKTHFAVNGQVDLNEANAFTQRALALLSPSTDPHVIEELRTLASQGTKIDHDVVVNAMNRAEADAAAQLASAQADLSAKARQLEDLQQQREIDRSRNLREADSLTEMLRRADQRRGDLEIEIEKLRTQEIQVRYETKEIVPEGFVTVEEAIAGKTRELNALTVQRDQVRAEVDAMADKQQRQQAALQQSDAGTSQFLAMKEQTDKLIAQYPLPFLRSLSGTDKAVKAAILTLGETFMLLGQQLTKAAE